MSVDIVALPFPLSIVRPDTGGIIPGALSRGDCFVVSSSSMARPFPLSRVGVTGETSPLFLREISMLTLLGSETRLLVPFELPLLSTCKLALVDAECRFCLCSGSVNSGYSPPAPAPSRGLLRSGCSSGIAITALSSGDLSLRLVTDRFCCCGYTLVELLGFHNRAALGRRGLPRLMLLLPTVPERLRNGDAKSGFPPPMRALRRLQRVGLVMRTCGSGVEAGIGEGVG
jgi:hypothetical protein